METPSSIVNAALDKISSVVMASNRSGDTVNISFQGDLFICISLQNNINEVIDLSEAGALLKLNRLLYRLYAITTASSAMMEVAHA